MNVAVIDCGTNSTRLLVADEHGRTLRREMTITRLGQGVAATGRLAPEALERVYACLRNYRGIMDSLDASHGRLVATSAARDAHNGAEFLDSCRAITGLEPMLFNGNEEAAASFRGATADLGADVVPMIVDIGGGSTELAFQHEGQLVSHSMQLGCVRVTEQTLAHAIPTGDELNAALGMIRGQLAQLFIEEPRFRHAVGNVQLVGLAGTVATVAALEAGMRAYDRALVHHQHLSLDLVRHWRNRLAELSPAERLELPGMVPGREDVMVGGLLVLEEVMTAFALDDLLTSENDILDGVAAQVFDERGRP